MTTRTRGWPALACLAIIATACTTAGVGTKTEESPGSEPGPASAAGPTPTRDERWTADVAYLVEEMQRIHPDLFHDVSRARFHRAADGLADRVPDLTDDQILVGLMRLAALPSMHGRDGHLGLWPPDNPDAVLRFPIRLWSFPDGLYITAAMTDDGLVGSRILRVNGSPIAEVLERIEPVVPRDTRSNLRDARTVFLTSAEVLVGLGLADSIDRVTLDVEAPTGHARTVTIPAVDAGVFASWSADGSCCSPRGRASGSSARPSDLPWCPTCRLHGR